MGDLGLGNIDFSIESLKSHIRNLTNGQRETLVRSAILQGILSFPFSICAFVAADTSNAGFNVVLTAFMYIGLSAGMYYTLQMQPSRSPLTVGFLIGVCSIMTIVSLMTAVFWGQLANCESINYSIAQYSCSNPSAYSAISFFASIIFLLQGATTYGLVIWRDDISNLDGDAPHYNKLPPPHCEPSNAYDDSLRRSADL